MARKFRYIVYRHGSNAANQSMTPVAVVGSEEAPDAATACRQMALRVTVYANQYLTARTVSRASRVDRESADEAETENDRREEIAAEWRDR